MVRKYLKGECQHCGGHLEFPVENIGMNAGCPHCGQETELTLAVPVVEPSIPRKVIVWTIVAVLVLVAGLIVALAGLKHFQRQAAARQEQAAKAAQTATNSPSETEAQPEDPAVKAGFKMSRITLEKTPGSSLVYAVGTLTNPTNRQRFGVRVEIDMFNAAEQKIGTAKDYQAVMEAGGEWKFKALVVDSKAVTARVAMVKEDR